MDREINYCWKPDMDALMSEISVAYVEALNKKQEEAAAHFLAAMDQMSQVYSLRDRAYSADVQGAIKVANILLGQSTNCWNRAEELYEMGKEIRK